MRCQLGVVRRASAGKGGALNFIPDESSAASPFSMASKSDVPPAQEALTPKQGEHSSRQSFPKQGESSAKQGEPASKQGESDPMTSPKQGEPTPTQEQPSNRSALHHETAKQEFTAASKSEPECFYRFKQRSRASPQILDNNPYSVLEPSTDTTAEEQAHYIRSDGDRQLRQTTLEQRVPESKFRGPTQRGMKSSAQLSQVRGDSTATVGLKTELSEDVIKGSPSARESVKLKQLRLVA